jgi:hypothetical protein
MTQKKQEETIMVVMASRQRAMKELGRVTLTPDTTSGRESASSECISECICQ